MSFKEKAVTAMEGLKSNASDIVVAAIEDCQKVIQGIPETSSWIPVTEQLPKLIPCSAGTGYSEAVIVWTSGRKAMIAVWDGIDFLCAADYWDAEGERITHWMPLPELPKEVPHGKQAKADTLLP